MIEDLQLKGYSDSTQSLYVSAVRQLCEHFNKPPGKITEDKSLRMERIFPVRIENKASCNYRPTRN